MLEIFADTSRTVKPRATGLTHVLDKGMAGAEIENLFEVAGSYVDIIKLGWGTSVVIENLDATMDACGRYEGEVCCGGSLFEVAVARGKLEG